MAFLITLVSFSLVLFIEKVALSHEHTEEDQSEGIEMK
jgi:hypothetical protein